MNMRKIQYILSGITLIALPLGIHAQQQAKDSTVNRTVVVEQEYTPDIPDASKINVLPQVEAPTANKKAVEYDVTLVPANTIPATVMQAYTGGDASQKHIPDISVWVMATTATGRTRRLSVHIVRPRPPQPEFPDERHGRRNSDLPDNDGK